MRDGQFVTRPLSLWLDLVRGLAALAVVLGHSVRLGVYTGPYPFSLFLERNAVIVFFVLSGLVIASSVDRGKGGLADFAWARTTRILPAAWGALIVTLGLVVLETRLGHPAMLADGVEGIHPGDVALYFTFLSEHLGKPLYANPPFWSLCYEVWYYALFAIATFINGWRRWLWLALAALVAGANALLLLPAWLIGVYLARDPRVREISTARAVSYVAAALFALWGMPYLAAVMLDWVRPVLPWDLHFSLYAPSDILLALAVALGFAGLRGLAPLCPLDRFAAPIRGLADISFSLYLLHWPVMKAMRLAGFEAGDSPLRLAAVLAAVVVICAGFAALTEHRREQLRALVASIGQSRRIGTAAG